MCPVGNELTARAVLPAQQRTELPSDFHEMIDDLKSIVRGAQVRAQLKVNTEMLLMYGEIGRTILERQGEERWGTKVVARIATELRTEFPYASLPSHVRELMPTSEDLSRIARDVLRRQD
jgi:hypothetical protein